MKRARRNSPGTEARPRGSSWELTTEAFQDLLDFLDPDPKRAGAAYEAIRHRLMRLFGWRGCPFPEELADETLNRVARKLQEGEDVRTDEPFRYVTGVARLIFHEMLRREVRQREALESQRPSPTGVDPAVAPAVDPGSGDDEAEARLRCLRRELQRLPPEQRRLILLYYEGEKGEKIARRRRLARELGIPINALRIRAHRIRRRLEARVVEQLKRKGSDAHSSIGENETDE